MGTAQPAGSAAGRRQRWCDDSITPRECRCGRVIGGLARCERHRARRDPGQEGGGSELHRIVGWIAHADRIVGVGPVPVVDAIVLVQPDGRPLADAPEVLVHGKPGILGGMQPVQHVMQGLEDPRDQHRHRMRLARHHTSVEMSRPLDAGHELHDAVQGQHDQQQHQDAHAGSVQQQ